MDLYQNSPNNHLHISILSVDSSKRTKKPKKGFQFEFDNSTEYLMDKTIEAETDITSFLRKVCAETEDDFTQLGQHQFVPELFKKFNAICTSSAPVERLFSYAGNLISCRKCI